MNTKAVQVGSLIIVLIIGIIIGGIGKSGQTIKSQEKVTASAKPFDDSIWRELKDVDDNLIRNCSDNFGLVTEIFDAQANVDKSIAIAKGKELEEGAVEAEGLAKQRKEIIQRLQ